MRALRVVLSLCLFVSSVAFAIATERAPVLLSASGEAQLELSSGERIALKLPAGVTLEATAPLESGWIAAGTRPVPGTERQRDLVLFRGEGRTASEMPVPAGRAASLRQEPLPLIQDGRLAGLVWLEGDSRQSFGVRFAAWNGSGWDEPRPIATPGPGSQLALTAAHLGDGSWLLAWSAFDGHDDEIVWSRSRDGVWSRPQRVTAGNQVPDITPALTAAGRGALLAWSRYEDGEYRVVVSRFQNGKWSLPEPAGPAGSAFPNFEAPVRDVRDTGEPLLLFRTAVPRGWAVVELDTAGRPARAAALASAEGSRPVISLESGSASFRWPAAGIERTVDWEQPSRTERRP